MRTFAVIAGLAMVLVVFDSPIVQLASANSHPIGPQSPSGNVTYPPPVVTPPPPPDEPQRPVAPGTVTQGWDNASILSQVADHSPVRLVENVTSLLFETSYGNFFLSKDSPYFVGVSDRKDVTGESEIANSTFLVLFQGALLAPTAGKIDSATQNLVAFHYSVMAGRKSAGTLTVTYTFYDDRNKISVSFANSIGVPGDFQIVWLTFTTFDVVDVTTMPADVEQRFEDLKGYGGALQLAPNYEVLSATGIPDAVVKPDKGADHNRESSGLHLTVDDALGDSPSTYAGRFAFQKYSGNVVLTTFAAGHLTVDPQLVFNDVPQAATSYSSIQRKTFYDGEYYWAFWTAHPNALDDIKYASSIDGKTWNVATTELYGMQDNLPLGFSVANYGKRVVVVWTDSTKRYVRMETGLISSGSIIWDQLQTAYDGGSVNAAWQGGVTFSSSGNQVGIAYVTFASVYLVRYTCTGGASGCATGTFNTPTILDTGSTVYAFPVPVNDGTDNIAVVESNSDTIQGKTWISTAIVPNGGGQRCRSGTLITLTQPEGTAIADSGWFTAVPYGNGVSVFVIDVPSGNRLERADVQYATGGGQCAADTSWVSSYLQLGNNPAYVTAFQGPAGSYVFYTDGSPSRTFKALRSGSNPWLTLGTTTLSSYTDPFYVTAAQSSSHFLPLMFTRAYPPPPGISDGCTGPAGKFCLYYVSYPLPLDGEAAVNNPWATKFGTPFVTDVGGVVSPTTGLLSVGQALVGGTPSISLVYREPGLFYRYGSSDVAFSVGEEAHPIIAGIYYDLPWISATTLSMQGGQRFPLIITGQSGTWSWFNNTKGIRYTLRYTTTTSQYNLTFPSGAYTLFDFGYNEWTVSKVCLDTTEHNCITYNVPFGNTGTITDSSGRTITLNPTNITYGNGQRILLTADYTQLCSGGTSSDSGTLQVTDSMGRVTKYTVCQYELTKVESPNGGRVDYTYASYSFGTEVQQGTEAYSLPLLRMDIYNESGANTKARTLVFNWNFQNGEVVRVLVNTTDKSGAVQGVNEYVFNSAMGTASVRVLDFSGQVLYYDLETLNGIKMKDVSGNANDGTISGSTSVTGKYGKARDFEVSSDYIDGGDSSSTRPKFITVSAWVKTTSTTTSNDLVVKDDASGSYYSLAATSPLVTPSRPVFYIYGSPGVLDYIPTVSATVTDGKWHMLSSTFDGLTLAIYVDGVLDNSKKSTLTGIDTTPRGVPVVIGQDSYEIGSGRLIGSVDEVRIFSRALSSEDIGALYSTNSPTKGRQQNWYSINDQPHEVEGFVGDQTSASVVTQDAIDDWGNQIYHKDPTGNETFGSFANTNHQNHFYAPGSLVKNTTPAFQTEFIDFSQGVFPTGQGTWTVTSTASPAAQVDYSTFDKVTPSFKMNAPSSGSTLIRYASGVHSPTFLEFRARVSAIQHFEIRMGTASSDSLMGVRFTNTGQIQFLDWTGWHPGCTYYGNGQQISYTSNSWYRFTFEIAWDNNPPYWQAYVNGMDVYCGQVTFVLQASDVYQLTFETFAASTWSSWLDDVKIYKNNCTTLPNCALLHALDIGFVGLQPRQSIRLLGEDGSVVDQRMQTGTGALFLSFNSATTGAYKYYESGDNAKTTVQIYAEDGTLEYQSPLTRFFVGEQYTYARPRAFADELVRTRSGALYWPNGPNAVYADEKGFCSQSGYTCTPTGWNGLWKEADIQGANTTSAIRGNWVHYTPFDYGYREHSFTMPATTSWGYWSIYLKIPSGKAPDSITFGVHDYTANVWRQVTWGTGGTMGPLPNARDQWVQLLVAIADLGFPSGNQWNGAKYGISGGEIEWDVTTTLVDTDTVTVTGLDAIAGTQSVAIISPTYVNTDGSPMFTATEVVGGIAKIHMYVGPSVGNPKLSTTFPMQGPTQIKIYDSTNEYYFGPLRSLWAGDTFTFVGQSSFFDSKFSGTVYWPQSTIHTAQIGAKKFSGDCLDAVLCYEMETMTETTTTVDTGVVSVTLLDLSGHSNTGTFNGKIQLSSISQSAASLGTSFDGSTTYVSVSDASSLRSSSFSISLWLYPTVFPMQFTRIATKSKRATTPYQGWIVLYDGGAPLGRIYLAVLNSAANNEYDSVRVQLALNALNHIVFSFDGTNIRAYLNGVPQATTTFSGTYQSSTNSFVIGTGDSDEIGISGYYAGTIDQFLFYGRTLTDTQVLALYQTRMPGSLQVYVRSDANGHGFPVTSRVPFEGTYLSAAATYDTKGNVLTVTDIGLPRALFYDMETCVVTPCASGGSMLDLSSNKLSGVISGTTDAAGKYGRARDFNNNYIDVGDSSLTRPATITVSTWVKTNSTANQWAVSKWDGATAASSHYVLIAHYTGFTPNRPDFSISDGTTTDGIATVSAAINDGSWHMLTGTFDGKTISIYVDGRLDNSKPTTITSIQTVAKGMPLVLGQISTKTGWGAMIGTLDEVHIIPQALSSNQVANLYNSGTVTNYAYSTLDGQDYRTQVTRPDGKQIYTAYDFQTGVKYGKLDIDCRRSRVQYDALGRPTQTAVYDNDPNEMLHLDMETATFNSLKDVSCAGTTDSTNGQTVTMVGGTTEVAGAEGSARNFRGSGFDDYVRVTNAATLNPSTFTVSFWINPTAFPTSYDRIISKDTWNSICCTRFGWTVLYNGVSPYGRIYLALWNSAGTEFDSQQVQLTLGVWQHVTFTFDGTNIKAYINGALQSCSTCGITGTFATSSYDLIVGAGDSNSITSHFNGKLDDVRFFTVALGQPDISNLWGFKYKLLTRSSVTYDDMISNVGWTATPTWGGYQFASVTTYDGVSTPRALYFDMQTMKFSGVSGITNTLEDLSGNGNHATFYGTTGGPTFQSGKIGQALKFTASNSDHLDISYKNNKLNITGPLTIAAWVNLSGVNVTNPIFTKGYASSLQYYTDIHKSGANWYFGVELKNSAGQFVWVNSTTTISTGVWTHVAFTYDGCNIKLYINGAMDSSTGTIRWPLATTTYDALVGAYAIFPTPWFDGSMDELQVIPRDLSATEVASLYAGYNQGTFTPQNFPAFNGNTGTTSNCGGTDNGDWANPNNAISADGVSATAAPSAGQIYCTDWNTFNFNVPAGAVINNVKVVAKYDISAGSTNHYGLHVGLVDTNGGTTNCPYQEDSSQPTALTVVTFDFTSCKAWTSADFNSNNIKVDVGGHRGTGGGKAQTFNLDYVSIQVSYTIGSGTNVIDGTHISRTYMDGLGRPVRQVVIDLYGRKITTIATLGWNDQPITFYIPSGGSFTYTYDLLGRTLTVQTPGDSTISGISRTIVSEKARMIESVDAVGRKVYAKTDVLGRTIETAVWNVSSLAYGNKTSVTYNALSKVTANSDAKGQTTTIYYNSLGRPKMTVFPDGTYSVVYYDDNLRAFQTVDVMGRVSVSVYDSLGRVTSVTLNPSLGTSCTGCVVTYAYDSVHDDLLTIDNITAKITRTYDSLHRVKTEKLDVPSSSPTFTGTITYSYDTASKVTDIQYPAGLSTLHAAYIYDSLGRPVEVDLGTSVPYTKYAILTYDSAGRLSNIHYWKGPTDTFVQESYAYDVRDRTTQIKVYNTNSGTVHMQQDYTSYDRASDVLGVTDNMYVSDSRTDGVSNPKTIVYAYDGNGRISYASGPYGGPNGQASSTRKWTYDSVGNLLTSVVDSSTYSYTYTGWNELLTFSLNSMSFTYNAAGSQACKTDSINGNTRYTHDFLQRLVKVAKFSPSCASDSTITYSYAYDGLGRRVNSNDAGPISYFVYAISGPMLYSKDGSGNETAYVYVGARLLMSQAGSAGNPLYYHEDISSNVRFVHYYTTSVATFQKYRWLPFGEQRGLVVNGMQDSRFRFAGQERDPTTLDHMGARYYDSQVMRFIERDPIGPGYGYASNNPISFIDPTGMVTLLGTFLDWVTSPQGRTTLNVIFLAVAVATAIPSDGASLLAYAALAGGLAVGAIFVAYTYVSSGGKATADDYIAAFTLGFTIGAIIGGGVGYAFNVMRAAPELGAARVGPAIQQSVKAETEVATEEGLAVSEKPFAIRSQMAADGGTTDISAVDSEPASSLGPKVRGGRAPHDIEQEYTARVRAGLESEGSTVKAQGRLETPYGDRIEDLRARGGERPGYHEVKGGMNRLPLNGRVAEEIAKDQWLVEQGETVYWHFFTTPTDELLSALDSAGIRVVVW